MACLKQPRSDNYITLTGDKGMTMVVLHKQDYLRKTQNLLEQKSTCRCTPVDLTSEQKGELINHIKVSKLKNILRTTTEGCTQLQWVLLSSMLRYTRKTSPIDPLFPTGTL